MTITRLCQTHKLCSGRKQVFQTNSNCAKQLTPLITNSTGHCHVDIQETLTLILNSQPTPERPWNKRWAILLRPDPSTPPPEENQKPRMIGVVGTPRESEVAYKLHPDYWGKGYMSEALAMFIKLFWQLEGQNHHNSMRVLNLDYCTSSN